MACITSSDPVVETHGGYPDAVERVNEVVAFYREHVPSLPASFPSATQHQALVRLALGMDVSLSLKTGGGKTLDAVRAHSVAAGCVFQTSCWYLVNVKAGGRSSTSAAIPEFNIVWYSTFCGNSR